MRASQDKLVPTARAYPFTNPAACLLQPPPVVNRGIALCAARQNRVFRP